MKESTRTEIIQQLLAMSDTKRSKCRVNDGNETMGEDGIATYRQITALCASWYSELTAAERQEKTDENWDTLTDPDEWLREQGQTQICAALCEEACGLRYDSKRAKKILDRWSWDNHWPLVDGRGRLTGNVYETDDRLDCLNVNDDAMVEISDLTPRQIALRGGLAILRESGHCSL